MIKLETIAKLFVDKKSLKIDFGGGLCPRKQNEGFKTCDKITAADYPNIDFELDKLPFDNNSVAEAYCSHTLEHLRDVKNFLNELHRVLKKDGTIEFIVPYGLWSGAQKPVHYQIITPGWFDFLRKNHAKKIYGYERWEILQLDEIADKGEIYELRCVLRPLK